MKQVKPIKDGLNVIEHKAGFCEEHVMYYIGRCPHSHFCKNKAILDGLCKQHQPDTLAQKAIERDKRYMERRAQERRMYIMGASDADLHACGLPTQKEWKAAQKKLKELP